MVRSHWYVALVLAALLVAAPGFADDWVRLGSRDVADHVDHDSIHVSGVRGVFARIKLEVKGGTVEFEKVTVHFANGEEQTMVLRNTIHSGGSTRSMDLKGDDRMIRRVDFWYRDKMSGRQRAEVTLFGRH